MHLLQIAGSNHSPACKTEVVFLCKAPKKQVLHYKLLWGAGEVGGAKKFWFTTLFCLGVQVDLQKLLAVQASHKIPMLFPQ